MLAAIDWNEVLMKAQMGAVLGGVGGACIGLVAYLMRKSDDQKQSEAEAYERERMRVEAGAAKTTSPVLIILALLGMIAGGAVIGNPSLVAPLLGSGRDTSDIIKPSATITDFGRYRDRSPIRVVRDRNTSSGVSVSSDKDYVHLEQTDQIPCRVGETWGFRFRASDIPTNRPYTVRRETHHPAIKFPDGSVRTKDVAEFKLRTGAPLDPFCGWYFLKDYEHEMVVGEWTLVMFIDDIEIARKTFNIRK